VRDAARRGRARAPVDQVLSGRDDFLLFDIEVAFLYPWAIAFRDLGVVGYWQIVTFFALLVTGYIYVWRKGAFDWSGDRAR
jgi:hypothetical protein